MRRLVLVLAFAIQSLFAQVDGSAKSIYSHSEQSVFLIYTNDSNGSPNALGSGFIVAPHTIATNAHVISGGNPVLAVGPVRIPPKVVRTDELNDLAILTVDADLTSKPLRIADGPISPGDQIFAIGNPEGLEKTISQGIVSGLRTRNGRDLIQITSPISHGSSGGPILDSKGEVIGVAVGMIEEGQNLNFAVPVSKLRELLANPVRPTSEPLEFSKNIEKAKAILDQRDRQTFSADPDSPYQQSTQQLVSLVEPVVRRKAKPEDLKDVLCLGIQSGTLLDTGIEAARSLVRANPIPESHGLLAYGLFREMQGEAFKAMFAEKGSTEETRYITLSITFTELAATL